MKRITRFLKYNVFPFLIYLLLSLLYKTLKIEVFGEENTYDKNSSKKNIFGVWHGDFAPFAPYFSKRYKKGLCIMTSLSDDGELLSRIIKLFGGNVVRGDERRGGRKAFVDILRRYKDGNHILFALDGPLGPYRKAKSGILIASRKLDEPYVLLACITENAWRFNSWDRFFIPKPFSRVRLIFSETFNVESDDLKSEAGCIAERVSALENKYAFDKL